MLFGIFVITSGLIFAQGQSIEIDQAILHNFKFGELDSMLSLSDSNFFMYCQGDHCQGDDKFSGACVDIISQKISKFESDV